ncbi:MAG: GIY-YIG nuclease family protein [Thiohalospira sp.]
MDKVGAKVMNIPKFYEVLFGVYIYVLELQNGKYYVGISRNPEYRFYEHRIGKTSKFVEQNLPIKNIRLKLLDSTDWSEGLKEETRLTVKLIGKFGLENVCGGAINGDLKRRTIRYSRYKKHGRK